MEVPQAMLLEWAKKLDGKGMMLNTRTVADVQRQIATYATSNEVERKVLQRKFWDAEEW